MKFVELTKEEFSKFANGHEQESFFQTVGLGDLRKIYGSEIYYLGVKEKNKVVLAAMFTVTKTFCGKKTFYAPRGYLADYNDIELIKFFTKELETFCKKRNGLMIKIDPNIVYRQRGNDGSIVEGNFQNDKVINDLKKLGYKHYGFNLDFVYTQSRWNVVLELNKDYEELKKGFSKSTRKNIEATYKKGVRIRKGTEKDLDSMEDILVKTADRKNFKPRSLEYYRNMYHCLGNLMNIYIAYLDPDIYLESTKEMLEEERKHYQEIEEKMEHDNIGNKLINQKETSLKLIQKLEHELQEAIKFKQEHPKGCDIGALVSFESGQEYITFHSGILVEYKKFTPKYLMYDAHIKDAYKKKIKYANFYGISGHFNQDDKDYGMFEFKKGFGGNVVELIGEFTYPLHPLYYVYMFLRNLKRKIKGLKG